MIRALVLTVALLLLAPCVEAQSAGAVSASGTASASASASASTPNAASATPPVARGYLRVTLPVATRDFVRGDTLRAGDFAMLDTTIVWRWASAPDTNRAVAGWIARRPIATGEVLRAPAVMAPPLVLSGAMVTVIYQDGPVRLVLTGVATNTAPFGAPVGVRIDRTRRLDGIAVAPNTVRLR